MSKLFVALFIMLYVVHNYFDDQTKLFLSLLYLYIVLSMYNYIFKYFSQTVFSVKEITF